MIEIKRYKKTPRRLFLLFTLLICAFIALYGGTKAYEQTNFLSTGEFKKAFEIYNYTVRIFDFEIEIPKYNIDI